MQHCSHTHDAPDTAHTDQQLAPASCFRPPCSTLLASVLASFKHLPLAAQLSALVLLLQLQAPAAQLLPPQQLQL